jgi:hypothetical protein
MERLDVYYKIVGKADEINDFYSKLQKLDRGRDTYIEFYKTIKATGIKFEYFGEAMNWIHQYTLNTDGSLSLCCVTSSWGDEHVWRHLLKGMYPSFSIYFAELWFMEPFVSTNDVNKKVFPGKWMLFDADGEPKCFPSITSACKYVKHLTGEDVSPDFEKISDAVWEYDKKLGNYSHDFVEILRDRQ